MNYMKLIPQEIASVLNSKGLPQSASIQLRTGPTRPARDDMPEAPETFVL